MFALYGHRRFATQLRRECALQPHAQRLAERFKQGEAVHEVSDLEHFSCFLLDHLLRASGVADVNSNFVLRAVKRSPTLPLAQLDAPRA